MVENWEVDDVAPYMLSDCTEEADRRADEALTWLEDLRNQVAEVRTVDRWMKVLTHKAVDHLASAWNGVLISGFPYRPGWGESMARARNRIGSFTFDSSDPFDRCHLAQLSGVAVLFVEATTLIDPSIGDLLERPALHLRRYLELVPSYPSLGAVLDSLESWDGEIDDLDVIARVTCAGVSQDAPTS